MHMAKRSHSDLEINQVKISLADFMGIYNVSIPDGFPHATVKILQRFQMTHPKLFGGTDTWSMDKHRKRFMDWMYSHRDLK